MPSPDAIFDVAVAIEVFEHIEDDSAAMRELARTLKPGGGSDHYHAYALDLAV